MSAFGMLKIHMGSEITAILQNKAVPLIYVYVHSNQMCRLTADLMTGRCNKMQFFHELQHFRDQLITQHRVPHHELCFRDQVNQSE